MHRPVAFQFAPLTSVWTQLMCFDRCLKYSKSGTDHWISWRHPAEVFQGDQENPALSHTSPANISGLHAIPYDAAKVKAGAYIRLLTDLQVYREKKALDCYWKVARSREEPDLYNSFSFHRHIYGVPLYMDTIKALGSMCKTSVWHLAFKFQTSHRVTAAHPGYQTHFTVTLFYMMFRLINVEGCDQR